MTSSDDRSVEPESEGGSTTADPEELVRRYSNAVQDREWDTLRELVTDDFVVHEPETFSEGLDDIEDHIESLKPFEWDLEYRDIFSDGDKVAVREVVRATQIEEFNGLPPSDEEMAVSSILIWRIEDGKIAEVWSSPDTYEMMDQLGVTFPEILVTMPKMLVNKIRP